jgi:hypothetical protein
LQIHYLFFFSLFIVNHAFCQSKELKVLLDSGIIAIQKSDYKAIIFFHEKALPLAEQETINRDRSPKASQTGKSISLLLGGVCHGR